MITAFIFASVMASASAAPWSATIFAGVGFFLAITLLLVAVLLIAKHYLVHSGNVTININGDGGT